MRTLITPVHSGKHAVCAGSAVVNQLVVVCVFMTCLPLQARGAEECPRGYGMTPDHYFLVLVVSHTGSLVPVRFYP